MSEETRITLLLGAMEEVFQSHIDTLSYILEMLEDMPVEEKLDMSWSLGWNLARMQTSLQSASDSLCSAMKRKGLEPPDIYLEADLLGDPEEFILFWTEHLSEQVKIIRSSYQNLQKDILKDPGSFDEDDDFWDESLRHLLDS